MIPHVLKQILLSEVSVVGGRIVRKILTVLPPVTAASRRKDLKALVARFLLILCHVGTLICDIADIQVIKQKQDGDDQSSSSPRNDRRSDRGLFQPDIAL